MEYRKQQFQTYDEFARQFPTDYTMPFARGGHAELYRGVDAETNDEVAIKRRLYSVGDDLLSLEKEYTNTQEVPASRFVVRYQYYGRYATPFGTYEYLVMRYYRDGNLTNNVLPWAQLSPPLQRRFVEEFLLGLEHLHSHSIVHRDIKPENVLMVRYAEGKKHAYRPVLADFGISKVLAENHEMAQTLIQRSMRVGTVTYMAPEQLRGERITYNSDLWSFGIILYEIITGKHMIARRSFPEQQREEAYSFWRAIDDQQYPANLGTVPQPYQAIIRRCLVVEPTKRIRRATELLDLMAQPPQFFEAENAEWAAADALAGTLPERSDDTVGETPVPLASQLTQQLTEQLDLPIIRPMPVVEPIPDEEPINTQPVDDTKPRRNWFALPFGRKKPQPADEEPLPVEGVPLVEAVILPPVPVPVADPVPVVEPTPVPIIATPEPVVEPEPIPVPVAVAPEPAVEPGPIPIPVVAVPEPEPASVPIAAIPESVLEPEPTSVPVAAIPEPAVVPTPTRRRKKPAKTPKEPTTPALPEVPKTPTVREPIEAPELPQIPELPEAHESTETPELPQIPEQVNALEPPETLESPDVPEPTEPEKEEPARPPGKPLSQRGRELLDQTRLSWTNTRLPARIRRAYRRTGVGMRKGTRAAQRSAKTGGPARYRYLIGLGIVLAGIVLAVYALRTTEDTPAVVADRPITTYQAAVDRYKQHRDRYVKTGQLDNYLWMFIHCYPDYEDSLVQSAILRVDNIIVNNMMLFPTYEDRPNELKRLEVKHLVRDKMRWEARPDKATLPCPVRPPANVDATP